MHLTVWEIIVEKKHPNIIDSRCKNQIAQKSEITLNKKICPKRVFLFNPTFELPH